MTADELTYRIIGAAMAVHSAIGPGSLEKVYDACFAEELKRAGWQFERQERVAITYGQTRVDGAFRVDYVVEKRVLVELKAVEKLHPLHKAQLLSYLKLRKLTVGLLINFNVVHLRDGIVRVVNGYDPTEVRS